MKTISVPPRASALIEGMRDFGYSLETALADVIDNSITAGATEIRMFADTSAEHPRLAIIDNGHGMSFDELCDAMRPGSRSPLEQRKSDDLGRFGLGLKTASFSQGRRLTVVSKREDETVSARWDLDHVAKKDDWLIEIPLETEEIPWAEEIGQNGTMILWEKLDRLVEKASKADERSHVIGMIDQAIDHLQLVFHRFLAGEKGINKVSMYLNNRKLEPFDPFHSSHPATISGPVEKILTHGQTVAVQTFTLPHHKKVSPADWEKYAGAAGYMKNQGFYVYRGKRLIIHGTWFRLARQMELTKLARVRIDMPNGLDAHWKIDVKKASAHPPHQVRERLRRIIDTIGATSKRVYTTRGRRLTSDSRLPVWQRVQDKNQISYSINREHPAFAGFMSGLSEQQCRNFLSLVEMTGAAIPIDALFADVSGQPENVSGGAISLESLEYAVAETIQSLSKSGLANEGIIEMLRVTEPFRSNWVRIVAIIETVTQGMETHV
ncbi:MAG: ATP-binding protein [Parasphingorhabdus sp.]